MVLLIFLYGSINVLYASQKVNIDIGAKILKAKCSGCKTYFPGTFFNIEPCFKQHFASSTRYTYSHGCRNSFLMSFWKFACGLGFAGRRDRKITNNEQRTTNKQQTANNKQQTNNKQTTENKETKQNKTKYNKTTKQTTNIK